MNAKKLRAAAQRSMDCYAAGQDGEPQHETVRRVYGTDDSYEAEQIAHADMLACFSHVLATVRDDDDEPVTVEWLKSECGFYGDDLITHRWVTHSWRLYFVDKIRTGVVMYSGGDKHYSTRGDVRKLCQSLGIELKGQS